VQACCTEYKINWDFSVKTFAHSTKNNVFIFEYVSTVDEISKMLNKCELLKNVADTFFKPVADCGMNRRFVLTQDLTLMCYPRNFIFQKEMFHRARCMVQQKQKLIQRIT